jgi:hypothetical protein
VKSLSKKQRLIRCIFHEELFILLIFSCDRFSADSEIAVQKGFAVSFMKNCLYFLFSTAIAFRLILKSLSKKDSLYLS